MSTNAVVIAGDWHMDTKHAVSVIRQLPSLLPDEENPIIIQLGDFGVWPGYQGVNYLEDISEALAKVNGNLYFIDGNHEDHKILEWYADDGRFEIRPRVTYWPRSYRFTLGGVTFLTLGGAVSVDRALRSPGVSWFPEEALTVEQVADAVLPGRVGVLLAHDAPSCVPLALGAPSAAWALADLARAEAHRDRVQEVVEATKPFLVVHGHYHMRQNWSGTHSDGTEFRVVSLDQNGTQGNIVVLDLSTGMVS